MFLHRAQRNHRADGKLMIIFLNVVQAQIAKINGGLDIAATHLQPEHTADDAAAPVLVQRVGFLQTLRPQIFLYGHHLKRTPFI